MSMERSHHCGDLRKADAGKTVTLCGWVSKRRDHGGIIFIDLRDRHGLVQVVIDPAHDEKDFHKAEGVRSEYVLQVRGLVRERSAETVNPHLPTGEVEVVVKDLNVLNPSKTPPFYIQDGIDVDENVRLRYRYLDLRRPEMQQNLILRHQVTKAIPGLPGQTGFPGNRDTGSDPEHPGRGPGLSGAQPCEPWQVLRPAPVSPAVQTAADDCRHGTVFPDCPVLPG